MNKRNSRACQLSNACKIWAEKLNDAPRLQQLTTITTSLESMNFENLQKLQVELDNFENESDSNEQLFIDSEKLRKNLIDNIKKLPVNQVKVAYYLFQNMRYTKGKNQGEIFSIYIQKKAIEFLKSELYKCTETKDCFQKKIKKLEKSQDKSLYQVRGLNSKITKLHKRHISKVRSYGRKLLPITNTKLKSVITKIIKENKKEFLSRFKLMTTQIA